jgi:hypothetical protein
MAPKRGKAAEAREKSVTPAADEFADAGSAATDLPDPAHLVKLTVPVLREWCTQLGLPTDGLKKDLVERVKEEVEKRAAGGAGGAKDEEEDADRTEPDEEVKEKEPEPVKEKSPEPVKKGRGKKEKTPAPEPVKEKEKTPEPEPAKEPTPEPAKEPEAAKEPTPEAEPEPVKSKRRSPKKKAKEPTPEPELEREKSPSPLSKEPSPQPKEPSPPPKEPSPPPKRRASPSRSQTPPEPTPKRARLDRGMTPPAKTAEMEIDDIPQPKPEPAKPELAEPAEVISTDAEKLRSLALSTLQPRVEDEGESTALQVSGFVRPLHLPSLKTKFETHGDVENFWIDSIRSKCIVVVSFFRAPRDFPVLN